MPQRIHSLTLPKIISAVLLSTFTISANAQNFESQILACRDVDSVLQRLACYDDIVVQNQTPNGEAASLKTTDTNLPESKAATVQSAPTPSSESSPAQASKPSDVASKKSKAKESEARKELPSTIGGTRFSDKKKNKSDKEEYPAKIVSCTRVRDNKHLFVFDNGQVWKQVRASKKRYKNCNFDVVVSKDIFGYKMTIAGKSRSVRINRKR